MTPEKAERTDVDIGELEALIRRCKQAGDPESRWIQGLLEDALLAKRAVRKGAPRTPRRSHGHVAEDQFTHPKLGNCAKILRQP